MARTRRSGARGVLVAGCLFATTACIPYTVGTTAQPVPAGDRAMSAVFFGMPSVRILDSDSSDRPSSYSRLGADAEARMGLDDRSDIGIRLTSLSGAVLNYKRLLSDSVDAVQLAIMPGAGIVNGAQHGHVELTLLASAREGNSGTGAPPRVTPYGGLRLMHVVPLAEGAVRDNPTSGGFLGVRIGSRDFGVSPEVGVFHDRSAMHVRRRTVVVVPAIVVHGDRLIHALGEILRALPQVSR